MADSDRTGADAAVAHLLRAFNAYQGALQAATDHPQALPALLAVLEENLTPPVAAALYLLMDRPEAHAALPRLVEWASGAAPPTPHLTAALRRAGRAALAPLLERIRRGAAERDADAVNQLLGLTFSLPGVHADEVMPDLLALLTNPDPEVRECAADAAGALGLPHGRPAGAALRRLAADDPEEAVRRSAHDALVRLGELAGSQQRTDEGRVS